MLKLLKNNSLGKMQLTICWSGSSHLHQWMKKSNCSSHIVTQFMEALFSVIHNNILKNLLSFIVTHSKNLLMSSYTPALVWHLRWTQPTMHINVVFRQSAYSLMSSVTTSHNSIVILPLSIVVHIIILHWWISVRVWYMYRNNHR